ncbi:hypothetical protein IRJ41_015902 [Triplophysa rosa]|uniref:Uncharacterized protein n=1 Tax=Triplophysa rosa TaxID=992332 RepID=A0A9W7THH7_TRIRA|nr:hypothetical protein IRJ41_015902 [Triplophysa rosa]
MVVNGGQELFGYKHSEQSNVYRFGTTEGSKLCEGLCGLWKDIGLRQRKFFCGNTMQKEMSLYSLVYELNANAISAVRIAKKKESHLGLKLQECAEADWEAKTALEFSAHIGPPPFLSTQPPWRVLHNLSTPGDPPIYSDVHSTHQTVLFKLLNHTSPRSKPPLNKTGSNLFSTAVLNSISTQTLENHPD